MNPLGKRSGQPLEKGHEYPLKKRLRLSMFFKAKQAAQPFVNKGSLGYMPQQWKK
jgi:hypothetical protein